MTAGTAPPDCMEVQAAPLALRADLQVYAPLAGSAERRYTLYDPLSDLSYFLGQNEWMVAGLFDGRRSLADISACLAAQHGHHVAPEKLARFAERLRALAVLAVPGEAAAPRLRDPAIGISYGPLKALLMIPVVRMQPAAMLDYLYARFSWLCSVAFVAAGSCAILAACMLVALNYDAFDASVASVYGGGVGWLLWHYPVVVVSIALHELGHALSCRHYKVRITDFGIAVYLLMATGWARPLQGDWIALNRNQRMVTIAMGPFVSLLCAAAGVALWFVAPPQGAWHTLAVVMAISSSLSLLPTLLPMFNGDTYLALTEYLALPRLRQQAFAHVKHALSRRGVHPSPGPRRAALYWATVLATVVGWLLAWACLLSLLLRIIRS